MIITQYEAREKYGMSVTALQKKAKKKPRPSYFIDTVAGAPRIDDQNPEWLMYIKMLEIKKQGKPNKNDNTKDMMRLINAVETVITKRYDEDEASEVKDLIILELKS